MGGLRIIVIVACLLMGYATIGLAQSNQSITVIAPPGATITVTPSNAPTVVPVNIMPPAPMPASDALVAAAFLNMRRNRMENPAYLGTQAFEVMEEEEVSWMEPERDDRGLPTGRGIPTTNWPTRLKPTGTNAPVIRGANKDGSVTLIFSKPVPAGVTVDVNIRQTP